MQVPYELLNKKFRAIQKILDREVSHVSSSSADLSEAASHPAATVGEISGMLEGVVQKLSSFKRKVSLWFHVAAFLKSCTA